MLLENKNAVVYGAGGAVGSAVARAFAREGARVFLAGRTLAKLDAVAQQISASGGVAEASEVDVLDVDAVDEHVATVVRNAGRIDILFNAIGMEDVQGISLIEMPLEDFIRPVLTAATTQFVTARAVAWTMVQQRSGVMMTITGGPAREATANIGGFGVACEAIEGLWRNLAAELGPYGVRLICVRSAGSPDTPAVRDILGVHARLNTVPGNDSFGGFAQGTLLGRLPLVAEVANVAAMMASDRASGMTGTYVNVTCGSRVD